MTDSKRYFFVFCTIFAIVLMALTWGGLHTYRESLDENSQVVGQSGDGARDRSPTKLRNSPPGS